MSLAPGLQRFLTNTLIALTGLATMAVASQPRAEPCPADATQYKGTYLQHEYYVCEGSLDGVPYLFYFPEDWQPGGPLIMNMYGYVPAVDVPNAGGFAAGVTADVARPGALRLKAIYDRRAPPWLALGYAVAVSRSTQGWVPHQRMIDTQNLRQYFIRQIGGGKRPYPSVISGYSMGGMQTYHLIENPDTPYDGALALCGFGIPSLKYLQEYVFNTRLFFDAEFPGELPGSVVDFPDKKKTMKNACLNLRETMPDGGDEPIEPVAGLLCLPIKGGAASRPLDGAKIERYLRITSIFRTGQIPPKVALDSELLRELHERSGGKNIFDNTDQSYPKEITGALAIPRYRAEAAFYEEVEITGDINKPVLAMHTTGDEFVPFKLTEDYVELVRGRGKLDNFAQLKTTRSGHCNFTDAELQQVLKLLDAWIRNGVRPSEGDFAAGFHAAR